MTHRYSPVATGFLEHICLAAFDSQSVRDWLVEGTSKAEEFSGAASLHQEQSERRGAMKGPFFTNYWWGDRVIGLCRPEGSKACEVDAMLFLEAGTGARLAIHIEHKRAGERFKFGQAEAYPLRAARFADRRFCPPQLVPHDEWMTLIFCDDAELGAEGLAYFERRIGHGEAREMLGLVA
ncbi:MAG: hypothetical protein V4551_03795 [Pseudomonadota bacterium]